MTVLFSSSFLANFSDWTFTDGSPIIVTSPVHHGTYAMECDANAEGVGETLVPSCSDLFLRCYVYFPSITDTFIPFLWIQDENYANSVSVVLYVSGANRYWYLRYPSGQTGYLTTINVGTWYCVEIERKVGTGNGVAKLWVNGINILSKTTETMTVNSKYARLYNGATFTVDYDCVVVADAYIGSDQQTKTLITQDGY